MRRVQVRAEPFSRISRVLTSSQFCALISTEPALSTYNSFWKKIKCPYRLFQYKRRPPQSTPAVNEAAHKHTQRRLNLAQLIFNLLGMLYCDLNYAALASASREGSQLRHAHCSAPVRNWSFDLRSSEAHSRTCTFARFPSHRTERRCSFGPSHQSLYSLRRYIIHEKRISAKACLLR